MPIDDIKKDSEYKSEKVYNDTIYFVNGIVEEFALYPEVMDALRNGKCTIEMRKRVMLRAIDETWVKVIEDSLMALDEIIRKPSRFIEEEEKVLPIEMTKSISSRSIKHLSQHTNLISEVDGDTVIPSKLLNVFQEETIKTYENKFVNTLLNRLYTFVAIRYNSALSTGHDAKSTSVEYKNEFTHGEIKGKIDFHIEIEQPTREDEVEKNYVMVSDLWKRVKRLYMICNDYVHSPFVAEMGNAFIRPPVMRTNAILKNRNLRQCLALWEFIESYENVGYSTIVEDTLLDMDETKIRELYNMMAMQYLLFRKHVDEGFDADDELAKVSVEAPLSPEIIEDLSPATVDEFNLHIAAIDRTAAERTVEENEVLRALEVALLADELLRRREELENLKDRYNRSFTARLILAREPAQTFYTEIKNLLLSYGRIRSRLSWQGESFTFGRNMCARLAVRGKTLVIYLPLDPSDEKYRTYHTVDMSEYAKYKNVPLAMKIRSRRAANTAKKLIAEVMEKFGASKLEDTLTWDFHFPYETKDQLIARGLIKVTSSSETPGRLPPLILDDAEEDAVITGENRTVYNRSFMARLIIAQEPAQEFYTAVKNCLLSYQGMTSVVGWKEDAFYLSGESFAKLQIKGKTPVLVINGEERKLTGRKAVILAKEEINIYMSENGIEKAIDFVPQDYHQPVQDYAKLTENGLIKCIKPVQKPADNTEQTPPTHPTQPEVESVTQETANQAVQEIAEQAEPEQTLSEQTEKTQIGEELTQIQPITETKPEQAEENTAEENAEEVAASESVEAEVKAEEKEPEQAVKEPETTQEEENITSTCTENVSEEATKEEVTETRENKSISNIDALVAQIEKEIEQVLDDEDDDFDEEDETELNVENKPTEEPTAKEHKKGVFGQIFGGRKKRK